MHPDLQFAAFEIGFRELHGLAGTRPLEHRLGPFGGLGAGQEVVDALPGQLPRSQVEQPGHGDVGGQDRALQVQQQGMVRGGVEQRARRVAVMVHRCLSHRSKTPSQTKNTISFLHYATNNSMTGAIFLCEILSCSAIQKNETRPSSSQHAALHPYEIMIFSSFTTKRHDS
jgi:hypothetical protein